MASSSPCTEDDLITCGVCFEIYNVSSNCPKFLSCHHTFCLACLAGIVYHGIVIRCPMCRTVTTLPANNIMDLHTNGHALKLAEHSAHALKIRTEAGNIAKLRAQVTQDIARLEKADKYLKETVEALDVLRSHAVSIRLDNTACLAQLKERLNSQTPCDSTLVDFDAKPCENHFSATLEKAGDSQLGLSLESASGRVIPLSKKINLDILVPITQHNLEAASTKVLGFSVLHLMKDELQKQPMSTLGGSSANSSSSSQNGTHRAVSALSKPAAMAPVQRSPVQTPAVRSSLQAPAARSLHPVPAMNSGRVATMRNGQALAPVVPRPVGTPKVCFMRLNVNGMLDLDPRDGECDLVFETTQESCATLCKIFERGCRHTSDMNYRDCTFLRACPGQFVLFGLDEDNVRYAVDPSLVNHPMISQRGDVGLYCEAAVDDPHDCFVWDFVVLLSDYVPHNLRPAPLVATLVRGFDLCENLSRLRAHERDSIEISYIRVH